jgi:hypothetical protein
MMAPKGPTDRAVLVSDLTAPAVLGLPHARAFLPFLTALDVPSAKVGRRRFARLDLILAALDRLSGATPVPWSEAEMIRRAITPVRRPARIGGGK